MEPEKLNLWDRLFNRYRRIVIKEGSETWQRHYNHGAIVPDSKYERDYVQYKVIDRVTGSETIEKKYL